MCDNLVKEKCFQCTMSCCVLHSTTTSVCYQSLIARDMWHVIRDMWRVTSWYVTCDMCALGVWHVTCDMWRVTCDMWHVTCDVWHVTCDTWHVTRDVWHMTCVCVTYIRTHWWIYNAQHSQAKLESEAQRRLHVLWYSGGVVPESQDESYHWELWQQRSSWRLGSPPVIGQSALFCYTLSRNTCTPLVEIVSRWLLDIISPRLEFRPSASGSIFNFGKIISNSQLNITNYLYTIILHFCFYIHSLCLGVKTPPYIWIEKRHNVQLPSKIQTWENQLWQDEIHWF